MLEEKNLHFLPINSINNNSSSSTINTIGEDKEETKKDFPIENEISHTSKNIFNTPSVWLKINIEPLKAIGFSDTQLQQLQNRNTPEIIQESIYHFAYGLEHNEKTKKYKDNALNVLMGVLRKGQAWIEPNYRSPQELALEDLISQKTNGQGADSVIITAGSSSLDPINFAGTVTRKKGKVIIVGAVPTGFDR